MIPDLYQAFNLLATESAKKDDSREDCQGLALHFFFLSILK